MQAGLAIFWIQGFPFVGGRGCTAGSWGLPRTGSATFPGWAAYTPYLFQPPDSGTDDLEEQEW